MWEEGLSSAVRCNIILRVMSARSGNPVNANQTGPYRKYRFHIVMRQINVKDQRMLMAETCSFVSIISRSLRNIHFMIHRSPLPTKSH